MFQIDFEKVFKEAQRFDEPYLLYYFKPFSNDVYQNLLDHLPDTNAYTLNQHPDCIRSDGSSSRYSMGLREERFSCLPFHQQQFWREVNEELLSDKVQNTIMKWHGITTKAYPHVMLMRDFYQYKINVHADWHKKIVTMQFYLPKDNSLANFGTSVYSKTDQFIKVRTLPFVPNTGYLFVVDNHSWHGVDSIPNIVRDSLMLIYYKEPWDEY